MDLNKVATNLCSTSNCSLLLIEDEPISAITLSSKLTHAGYHVEVAADGASAIFLAHRLVLEGKSPDLVLLDIHLPDMNGFEVAQRLSLPFAVITADKSEIMLKESLKYGAWNIFYKGNLNFDALLKNIGLTLLRIRKSSSLAQSAEKKIRQMSAVGIIAGFCKIPLAQANQLLRTYAMKQRRDLDSVATDVLVWSDQYFCQLPPNKRINNRLVAVESFFSEGNTAC